jgi:hypothetical protein
MLEDLTVNKKSVTNFVFMFLLIFFSFSGVEKHVCHIAPFRSTSYVLNSFRYVVVSNRLRNWNKVKNIIYAGSKFQLCQLDIPIFIYKLMCQSSLLNSVLFVFCEFYRVARWNEGKTIILVRSTFQIPKQKYWFPIQINVCQCKHGFS